MATKNDKTDHVESEEKVPNVESEEKVPPESTSYTQTLMTACNEAAKISKNVAHKVYTVTKDTVNDVIEAVDKYSAPEEENLLKKTGSTSVDPEIPFFPSQFYFIDPFSNEIPLPVPNLWPGHMRVPAYVHQHPAYNPPPPQPVYWPPPVPPVYPPLPPQLYQDAALFNPYINDYLNSLNKQWYTPDTTDSTEKDKKKKKKRKPSKTSKKKKRKRRSRKEDDLEDNETYSWSHPAVRKSKWWNVWNRLGESQGLPLKNIRPYFEQRPYRDTATVYQAVGSYEALPDYEHVKPTVAHMRQLNKRKKSQPEPPHFKYSSFDKKLSTSALDDDLYSEGLYSRRRSEDVVYADDAVGSDVDDWRVRRKSAATSVSDETVKLQTPPVTRVHSPEENVTRLSATLFRSLQVKLKSRRGNSLKVKRFNMDTQSAQLLGSFFSCEARAAKKGRPKHNCDRPKCGFSTQYRQTSTSLCGCSRSDYIDASACIPSNPGRHLKRIMSHFYSDLMNLPERKDSSVMKEGCTVNSNKSNTVLSAQSSPACTCDFKCQCTMDKKSESDLRKGNVKTRSEKCDDLRFSCPDTNTCRMGVLELSTKPHTQTSPSYRKCYCEEDSERSEETCSEDDLTVSSMSNNQSHNESDNRLRKKLAIRMNSPKKTSQCFGRKNSPSAVSFSQTFCVSSTRDCQVKISQNISATRRSSRGRIENLPLSYSVHGSSDRQKCKKLVCAFDGSATDCDSQSDEKPYKCLYVRARSRPRKSKECFRKCDRKYCLCHPQSSLAVCDLRHEDDGKYCKRRGTQAVCLSESSNENICICKNGKLKGHGAVSPRRSERRHDTFYELRSMDDYRGLTKCSHETNKCCCMPKCSLEMNERCYVPNSSQETNECCCLLKFSPNKYCCVPKCSLKTNECCFTPNCRHVPESLQQPNDYRQMPLCSQQQNDCRPIPLCLQQPNDCRQVPACSQQPNDCRQMPACSQQPNDCRQVPLCSQQPNDCRQVPLCSQQPNDCRQMPACSQQPNDCRQVPICSQQPNDCRQVPLCSQQPNDCRQVPICSQQPNDCRQVPLCSQQPNDCRQVPLCSQQPNDCRQVPICSQQPNDCRQVPLCSQQPNDCRQVPLCSQQPNDCRQIPACSQQPNDCRQVPLCSQQPNDCRQMPACSQQPNDCRQVPLCSQQPNDCRQVPLCSQQPNDCRQMPACSQQPNDCRQVPICSQQPNDCRQVPLCSQQPNDCRQVPLCSQQPNDCRQVPLCSQQPNDCRQMPACSQQPNDCRQVPICSQQPNDCRQMPACSQQPNDCSQVPLCSQQPNDCCQVPLYSQQPNDFFQAPLCSQQPNACRHEPLRSQQPNACRHEPLRSQQPNDCRHEPLRSQQPNDYRQATTCSQPTYDCRQVPVCSQLPSDFRQIQKCSPKFNDRPDVLESPEQSKECRQISKCPKEANTRPVCYEDTKECILPPNTCRPLTRKEEDNACSPLQDNPRQTNECGRLSRYSENTNDRHSLPDYTKQTQDCSPSGKHSKHARNNPNVCTTFKQTKAVTKAGEKCKVNSTLGEDKKNGFCDERLSDKRELCEDESNAKPRSCFTQPRSKKVTHADKETTCHLKVKTDKTKKGLKHKKFDSGGYLDSQSGDAANVCTRNQCDYIKDSTRKPTANELGQCDAKEFDEERKGSDAEKRPTKKERSVTSDKRTKSVDKNSRKDLPCDEIKVSELKPPSRSNECICDFDESIRCVQDNDMESASVKRKHRSHQNDIVKSKRRSRRKKTEDSKCYEKADSRKVKSKKKAKSEQSKSGRNINSKRCLDQESTPGRRTKVAKKSSSSSQNNKVIEPSWSTENDKVIEPSSSSSNDDITNPPSSGQSNESVTPSSSSSSDKPVDSSPSSSPSDQPTTSSSSDQLNEPEKDVKDKDRVDHDQSKNGASSKDHIQTNPEESFSQFSCRTNNSSETAGANRIVLDPIVPTLDIDDKFRRKKCFVKHCSPNQNVGSNSIKNKGNKYKFMFKKYQHGKSKWPECRSLELHESDLLPCITETKGSPLPYQIEQTHDMLAFNGACQERNQDRCYTSPRCSVAEVIIMPDSDNPSSSNSDCQKETKKLATRLRTERNKNLHSSNVNKKTLAARTKYAVRDNVKNIEPDCPETFSSTSLVYSSKYQRLLQYWEHICQRCQENTQDIKNASDSNESKVNTLPKYNSCQEKKKSTNTQRKPKSSQKFSTVFTTDDWKQMCDFNKRMGPDSSYSCSINQQTSEAECVTSDESCDPCGLMSQCAHKRKSTNRRDVNPREIITQQPQEKMLCFKKRSHLDSDEQSTNCSRIDCTQRHLSCSRADKKFNEPGHNSSGKEKRHTVVNIKQALPDYSRTDNKPFISSQNREDKKHRKASHSCADNAQIHRNHSFKDKKQMDRGYLDSESGEDIKKLYSSCNRVDKKMRNLSSSCSDNRQIHANHSKQKKYGNSITECKISQSSESREDIKNGRRRHRKGQSNHRHTENKPAKQSNSRRTDCRPILSNHSGAGNKKAYTRHSLDDSRKSSSNHSREDNKQKHSAQERAESKRAHSYNIHEDSLRNSSNPSLADNRKKCLVNSTEGSRKTCINHTREDSKQKQPISKCPSERKIRKHSNQRVGPCLGCTNVKSVKTMSPCKFCANTSLGRQKSPNPRNQTSPNPGHQTSSNPGHKTSPNPRNQTSPNQKNQTSPNQKNQTSPNSRHQTSPNPRKQTSFNGANVHLESMRPPCFKGSKGEKSCAEVIPEMQASVCDNEAMSQRYDCAEQTRPRESKALYTSPCLTCTNVKPIKKESPCFTCSKRKHESSVLSCHSRYQTKKTTNECPQRGCANVKGEEKTLSTHSNDHSDQAEPKSDRKHQTIISSPNSPTMLNQDTCCTPSSSDDSRRTHSKKHTNKHKTFRAEPEVAFKPDIPCVCCVLPQEKGKSTSSISDRMSTGPTSKSKASSSGSSQKLSRKSSAKEACQSEPAHMGDQASLTIQISLSASSKESNLSFGGSTKSKSKLKNQPSLQCLKNAGDHAPGVAFNGSVPSRCPPWENVKQSVNDSKVNAFPLYCYSKPQVEDSFHVLMSTDNGTNIVRENGGMVYRENKIKTFISEPSSCALVNNPTDEKLNDKMGPFVEETLKDNMYSQIWFNLLNLQRNVVYDFDCPLSSESNATRVTSISSLPLSQAPDWQRASASKVSCHGIHKKAHQNDTITHITACDQGAPAKTNKPSPSGHGADNISETKSLSKNNSDELEIISLEDDWNNYYSVSGKSEECQSQNCSIPPSSPLEETFTRPDKNSARVDGSKPSSCLPSEQGPSIVTSPQSFGFGRACPLQKNTEAARDTWKMSRRSRCSQGRASCLAADVRKGSNYRTNLDKKNAFECGSQAVKNKHTFDTVLHKSSRQYSQLNNTLFKCGPTKKSIIDCQNKRSMYFPDYGSACRPPRSPSHRCHAILGNEPKAYRSSMVNSIFNIQTQEPGTSNARYQFLRSHLEPFGHSALSSKLGVNVLSAEIKAKILSPPGYHQVRWRPPVHCTQASHISDEAIVKYLESCTAEEFWRYLYKVKQNYSSDDQTKKNCKSSQTYFSTAKMSTYDPENGRDTLSHDLEQPIIYPQHDKAFSSRTSPNYAKEMNNLAYLNPAQPNNSLEQTHKPVDNWQSYNLKCEVCSMNKNESLMKQEKRKEINPVFLCRKHLATQRHEVKRRDDTRCCCRNHSHSPKYPTHISIHINTDSPKRNNCSGPTSTTQSPPGPSNDKKGKKRYRDKVAKSESETSSADSSGETTEEMMLKFALANKLFKDNPDKKVKKHKTKKQKNRENKFRKLSEKKIQFSSETDQSSTSTEDRRFTAKFIRTSTSEIDRSEGVSNHVKNESFIKGKEFCENMRDEGSKRGQYSSPTLAWTETVDSRHGSSAANVKESVDLQGFNGQGKITNIDRLLELDIRELLRDTQDHRAQSRPQATDRLDYTKTSSRFPPEVSSEKPSTSKARTSQHPMKTRKTLNLCQGGVTIQHSQTATVDSYINTTSSYSSAREIQRSQISTRSSTYDVKKQNFTYISTMLQDARLNRPVPTTGRNIPEFRSKTILDISDSGNRVMPKFQWKINQNRIDPESHVNEEHQDGVDKDNVPNTSSVTPATLNTTQQGVSIRDHSQSRPKLAFVLTSPPASIPAVTPVSLNRFTSLQTPEDF